MEPTPKELHDELINIGNNEPVLEAYLLSYPAAQKLIQLKVVEIKDGKYCLNDLGKKAFTFRQKIKTK
jgi:hypothetical protein